MSSIVDRLAFPLRGTVITPRPELSHWKMMYSGTDAIRFLAENLDADDPLSSSHWREYHAGFRFSGEGFEGLTGFGGIGTPHRGIRLLVHRLLQRKYRRMARVWSEFPWIDRVARAVTGKQNRTYDLDVLRQVLALTLLRQQLSGSRATPETVCVIGDGFATMTTLLLATGTCRRVITVNLSKTLLVDLWYLRLWLGDEAFQTSVDLVTDEADLRRALADNGKGPHRVIAIRASDHRLLRHCPIDLAINIASMQEMDPGVTAGYFEDLRAAAATRPVTFYCCNREEKTLPDGTVARFSSYPWSADDEVMLDELCPWHQEYYATRPPYYRPYDGPIRHRLVVFDPGRGEVKAARP